MSGDIGVGILIGAGVLFTIVASTYVMAYFVDTVCSTPEVERVSSPVSNKAGLWGMSLDERTKILEKVFQRKKTIRNYHRSEEPLKKDFAIGDGAEAATGASKEIEMTEIKPAATVTEHSTGTSSNIAEIEASGDDLSADDTPTASHEDQPDDDDAGETTRDLEMGLAASSDIDDGAAEIAATSSREEQITMGILPTHELSPESLETMCAICLVEYDNGDRILHGTNCSHYFHISCIMEWMEKGHDHCPFCRELMLSPQDMREAAVEALGKKRVEELSCRCTPPERQESAPSVPIVASAALDTPTTHNHSAAVIEGEPAGAPAESTPKDISQSDLVSSRDVVISEIDDATSQKLPVEKPETAVDEVKIDTDGVSEYNSLSPTAPSKEDAKISHAKGASDSEDVEA